VRRPYIELLEVFERHMDSSGAALTDARNPTREQLASALIGATTILPPYLIAAPAAGIR
jgi:hypothetical protein